MRALPIVAGALLLASPAPAEIIPRPDAGDPRIQIVDYDPAQVFRLEVSPGYALTVELSGDERVENVALGDSSSWQVTPNKRGDRLFLKHGGGATETNMTVVTDARRYVFVLSPTVAGGPYLVRFLYPGQTVPVAPRAEAQRGSFLLKGAIRLRPREMHDDGVTTFILWPTDLDLPAVYTIDARGRETIVNGAMRGAFFVVDAVSQRFVFRSGRDRMVAIRQVLRP